MGSAGRTSGLGETSARRPATFVILVFKDTCWRAISFVSRLRNLTFQLAMDTSLDETYPLRDARTTGIVHTDSSMEFQVQHSSQSTSVVPLTWPPPGLQNYRNDLVIKWLESIRSNQITSVIKESVCEATKLKP